MVLVCKIWTNLERITITEKTGNWPSPTNEYLLENPLQPEHFVNACLCSTWACVARPLNSVHIFHVYIFTQRKEFGEASVPTDVSGPCSTPLCLAPFCVFLETRLPCVAQTDPWDVSQYISVSVACANVYLFSCVSTRPCMSFLGAAFGSNSEHKTFVFLLTFMNFSSLLCKVWKCTVAVSHILWQETSLLEFWRIQ